MKRYEEVGVMVVCYNTPAIISTAVMSVQPFVGAVIVINNSDITNPAYEECRELAKLDRVTVSNTHSNIGHGPGLNIAVGLMKKEYLITMDSDAVLLQPTLIGEMLQHIKGDDVYGVGRVVFFKTPYLYLPFAMIKRSMFYQYKPFIHSGAPAGEMMKSIDKKKRLVNLPDIMSKIQHEGRATRKIAGHWRKGFGGKDGV